MRLRASRLSAVANALNLAPSLDLDFANMGGVLDSRVTFSRGSIATMFDASGNLVYAPLNICHNSEDLTGSGWSTAGTTPATVTANAALSPTGMMTADLVDLTPSADARVAFSPSFVPVGSSMTASVWLRAPTGQSGTVTLRIRKADGVSAATQVTITDTWARYSFTAPPALGSTSALLWVGDRSTAGTQLTFYAWGVQLEPTAAMTDYKATSGAAYHGPRFTYDPATLSARGLLIEPSRTNLCILMGLAGQATTVSGGTSSSAPANKLGNWTPLRFTGDGVSSGHFAYSSSPSVVSGTVYTASVIITGSSNDLVQLSVSASYSTNAYINVRMSTGAVTSGAGASNAFAVDLGGGCRRIGFTFTATASATAAGPIIFAISSEAAPRGETFAWSGTIDWFGGQLEAGAYATSLIPTVGATQTRLAESATMTGSNLTSWYRSDEWTLYSESRIDFHPGASLFPDVWRFSNAAGDRAGCYYNGNPAALVFQQLISAVTEMLGSNINANVGSTNRHVVGFRVNDGYSQRAGGVIWTDTSMGVVPNVNTFSFGVSQANTSHLGGTIKRLTFYPRRLSNPELAALVA